MEKWSYYEPALAAALLQILLGAALVSAGVEWSASDDGLKLLMEIWQQPYWQKSKTTGGLFTVKKIFERLDGLQTLIYGVIM